MNELEQLLKRLIEFALLTDEEEKLVRKSLLNIEIQLHPKTKYIEYIEEFNAITGKKYKPEIESRELFYENIAIYSNTDRLTALKNAITDPWVKENSTILTPKWALKAETIGKYINYAASKSNNTQGKGTVDVSNSDYSKVSI